MTKRKHKDHEERDGRKSLSGGHVSEFKEVEHPRHANGRFGDKSGSEKDQSGERKREPTTEEKESIKDYTEGGYYPINKALRADGDLDIDWDGKGTTMRQVIGRIDSAIALSELSESTTVYRGVSGAFSKRLSGMKVGDRFSDPSFASTSSDLSYAKHIASKGDASGTMEIRVPKGFHALPLSKISSMPGESEILLKRNSTFKLVSAKGDHFVFEVQ